MHGNYRGLKTVHHSGGFVAFRTHLLRFPEKRFTVVCFSNGGGINPVQMCNRIADIYLEDEF